ncbi:hypothetical protein [Shinella curvata]|uniref:hypothetical protein n=1 Tax=Shinella curvata TaxID=1817964 RepID=UPI001FD0BA17|nr:hypothetical protein [Shinella curvata]
MTSFARLSKCDIGELDLSQPATAGVASLYHKAFENYGSLCFWSTKEMDEPSVADVLDAASRLKREGNMATRRFALRLEDACLGAP